MQIASGSADTLPTRVVEFLGEVGVGFLSTRGVRVRFCYLASAMEVQLNNFIHCMPKLTRAC